jgi:hypothetical protein
MPYLAGALVVVALVVAASRGHELPPAEAATPDVAEARSAAIQAARTRINLPLTPRILQVGANQVLVLDIPSLASPRAALVDTQRCYIWRDLELKTSSLSCPQSEEIAPALAPPPPSYER